MLPVINLFIIGAVCGGVHVRQSTRYVSLRKLEGVGTGGVGGAHLRTCNLFTSTGDFRVSWGGKGRGVWVLAHVVTRSTHKTDRFLRKNITDCSWVICVRCLFVFVYSTAGKEEEQVIKRIPLHIPFQKISRKGDSLEER